MKRAIFVFYLFVMVTMGLSDDVTERIADMLSLSRTDVQICLNKTNVVPEDMMKMDELVDDDVRTADIDKSALKIGCLFACLLQKIGVMSGAHINMEKVMELVNAKSPRHPVEPTYIIMRDQILNTCAERVKSKTDECEVTLKFFLCLIESINSRRQ